MADSSFERIREALTLDGNVPLECAFLVGVSICVWNPATHFHELLLRPDDLRQACLWYLINHNKHYDSLDAVVEVAIREKWPNREKLTEPREYREKLTEPREFD